jgi:CBS domain-containing protein
VNLMARNDIGSLVVLERGEMAGMLTFREVLRAFDSASERWSELQVGEVMSRDPICGRPDDTIDELRELMTRHHIRYLPVKDGGKLAGVVSFHDVAKAVIKETSMENRLLRRYIEHDPQAHAKS